MAVAHSPRLVLSWCPYHSGEVHLAPGNPVGEFGDKFRKAREAKDISLDDVSNVTKISSRMLQAIEQEKFDLLPGGVFNKGFIRAYAKHLGLNDEEAVTDYLACLRQAQVDAHEVWEPERPAAPRPAVPEKRAPQPYSKPSLTALPPVQVEDELPELQLPRAEDVRRPRRDYTARDGGIPWNVVAVAAVVIVVAAFMWIRHSRKTGSETVAVPAQAAVQRTSQPIAATTNPPSAPQPSVPQPSASAKPSPPVPASAKPPANTEPGTRAEKNDVTVRTLAPTAPPATPVARMTLVIRASETSWISVTVDGQPVTRETLIAPAATTFRATREIVARIGNSAGVSFLWNGQEIPAQGDESEVRTFVFDAQGMRVVPSTPPAGQNH
jgi:cytoskeleton protein RodZ